MSPAFQKARHLYMEAKARREALEATMRADAETAHPGISEVLRLALKEEDFLRSAAVRVFVEQP